MIRFSGELYSGAYAEDVYAVFSQIVNYGFYKMFFEMCFTKNNCIKRAIPIEMNQRIEPDKGLSKEIFIIGKMCRETNADLLAEQCMSKFAGLKKHLILYGDSEKIQDIKNNIFSQDIVVEKTPETLHEWKRILPKGCFVICIEELLVRSYFYFPLEWIFVCWQYGYIPICSEETKEYISLCVSRVETVIYSDEYVRISQMDFEGIDDCVNIINVKEERSYEEDVEKRNG